MSNRLTFNKETAGSVNIRLAIRFSGYSELFGYASQGYNFGCYSNFIFTESKALRQAHSKLCNWLSNTAIGGNGQIENQNYSGAKF